MADDLVRIAAHLSSQEAAVATCLLDDEGIIAFSSGQTTSDILRYCGSSVVGTELYVRRDDVERAEQLLGEVRRGGTAEAPARLCPECRSEVDAGFELCWSCGTVMPKHTESAPAAALPGEPAGVEDIDQPKRVSAGEELLWRAWRAGVLGLAFVPLQFYALYLLFKVGDAELSPAATRRYYGTIAVSTLNVFMWMWFLLWLRV